MESASPAPRSDALVFFGATGDLAHKMVFPALYEMVKEGRLDTPVVGVARQPWTVEQLRARAWDGVATHGRGADRAVFDKLASLLRYVSGDYRDPRTFELLRQTLTGSRRPLHYLAIPPTMFATVVEGLQRSGCATNARVVVEKPFGRDLRSARELDRTLLGVLPESAIFRIDHYLGKEPVQNLLLAALRVWQMSTLVDIRRFTRSRTNPQFNEGSLGEQLRKDGIRYVVLPALGGRRTKSPIAKQSRNAGWQNTAFKNYADYICANRSRAHDRELSTAVSNRSRR